MLASIYQILPDPTDMFMLAGKWITPDPTMICQLVDIPGPSDVLASKQIQSAWNALVIHIFCPLIIRSSPLRTALVVEEATSLPDQYLRDLMLLNMHYLRKLIDWWLGIILLHFEKNKRPINPS